MKKIQKNTARFENLKQDLLGGGVAKPGFLAVLPAIPLVQVVGCLDSLGNVIAAFNDFVGFAPEALNGQFFKLPFSRLVSLGSEGEGVLSVLRHFAGNLVAAFHIEVAEGTVPKVAIQGKARRLLVAGALDGINKTSVHNKSPTSIKSSMGVPFIVFMPLSRNSCKSSLRASVLGQRIFMMELEGIPWRNIISFPIP